MFKSHRVQGCFEPFQIMICDRFVFAESYEIECCPHETTNICNSVPISFSPNQDARCPSVSTAATVEVEDVDPDVNKFSVVVLVGIVLVPLTNVIICFVEQRRVATE